MSVCPEREIKKKKRIKKWGRNAGKKGQIGVSFGIKHDKKKKKHSDKKVTSGLNGIRVFFYGYK